jgi:ubiquinone/menaquinone biosynthesis C-methylase UbiE
MDFSEVNLNFAKLAVSLAPNFARVLDVGTGTARIPIIISNLRSQWEIVANDLAKSMLKIAHKNLICANKENQIKLELVDAKKMPYSSEEFDLVISNSLVHHLPNPLPFFREVKRVVKPQGSILIRDLLRPESQAKIEAIVKEANLDYNPHQQKLFADSLHAAFTLDEVTNIVNQVGLENVRVYRSSDLHWTICSNLSQL